jgi:hypothetical protein
LVAGGLMSFTLVAGGLMNTYQSGFTFAIIHMM